MNVKQILKWGCMPVIMAACMPTTMAQETAAPASAAAAVAAKAGIAVPKPAELMKLVQVAPGLYALHCAGMDRATVNSYGPYLAGAPVPEKTAALPRFGCSTVVNGDFVGRNMDLYISPAPYFIVWTDAGNDHYASLAVTLAPQDPENFDGGIMAGKADTATFSTPESLARLTTMALDGVNEKGVCCTTHVVDPTDAGNTGKGTNPGAPELSMFMVCRYVLEHAATADEAIELLKKRSICKMPKDVMFHWVVADPHHSYIVEVVGDQLRYTDKKKVMTNYLATVEGINAHPWGLERARILEEHYGQGTSVEGMYNLMRRVHFTQAYRPETSPYWYSEHYGFNEDGVDINVQTPVYAPEFRKIIENTAKAIKEATPDNNPDMLWETSYGNVYDMRNKTMRLMMHEKYDTYYDAKL